MNGSINPLFIARIVSFLWKPYAQSTQKPRAAPQWSLALPRSGQCLLLSNMSLLFKHPGVPLATCLPFAFFFCAIRKNFCCHSSLSVAALQWPVPPVPPELCPRSVHRLKLRCAQPWGWARGTATCGHAEQPMTISPAILNPVFITKTCLYPRLLLARWLLHRCLCCCVSQVPPVSWVSSSSQPDLWDQEPHKTQPERPQQHVLGMTVMTVSPT